MWETLAPYLGLCLLITVTPGLDTAVVVRSTLKGGMRSGLATALGCALGLFVHAVAVALGRDRVLGPQLRRWAGRMEGPGADFTDPELDLDSADTVFKVGPGRFVRGWAAEGGGAPWSLLLSGNKQSCPLQQGGVLWCCWALHSCDLTPSLASCHPTGFNSAAPAAPPLPGPLASRPLLTPHPFPPFTPCDTGTLHHAPVL